MSTQPAAQTNVPVTTPNQTDDNVPPAGTTEPKTVTVDYTSAGFAPAAITIKKGDTVTFTNSSGASMWVASAVHPTHEVYNGTTRAEHCTPGVASASFDQCENGATYSFKFDKAGTWGYHNHSRAAHFGQVIVVE